MPKKTEYTIHMIGHGHIDPTWLWRWTEGYEEVRATFRSALDRMKETPEFKFTASSACFYEWVKVCDPEMFEEIRKRVKEGRWEVVGGWWIEPDCNVPGGEALARHGLYSQRFFQREFGKKARVGFNADSFGHAGTFPQIYKKSGIDYYVYMRPDPETEMDYPDGTTFHWRAKDGSEILAANIRQCYNSDGDHTRRRIETLPDDQYLNPGQRDIMGYYGVGNHGGGPTKLAIRVIKKARKDKDMPEVLFSTTEEYFEHFLAKMDAKDIPTIDHDLQHHARGCYSVHAEVKHLNRAAEHALMSAERFAAAAWLLQGHPYPQQKIEEAWKLVLYNQFHDILAGTSIEVSYDDTRDQLGSARNTAMEIRNESLQTIARKVDTSAEGNTIMVVNPLPWPVKQTVKATAIVSRTLETPLHVVDEKGKTVPSQPVLGERIGHTDYVITADVPATGYRCYHARSGAKPVKLTRTLQGDRHSLENDWWRIEFDPYSGEMCRLYDKRAKVETLKKGNVLACMMDQSDTWSHGYDEWRVEAGRFADASFELYELGDVRATVRIVQRYGSSLAEQFVTIYRDVDTIDCKFRINWQERYTMLKLAYETNVEPGTATYDSPYGYEERNTEGFEEPGQRWLDLTGKVKGKAYGFAVLNDSKYGFDVRDGVMRVTMLRSPAYAFHDNARHDASEPWPIMDQGWHTIRIQLVPHKGGWQAAGVVKKAWELNEPAFTHIESAHKGKLPQSASFLGADAANVLLSVVKQTEDGEDIVVRGYETAGKRAKATIDVVGLKKPVAVSFKPHEIKTIRINRKTGKAVETDLLEE
ncbi:MAG: alpha-mannosidase [bacterium]|nr:alpha-mannosidase [bacterium]